MDLPKILTEYARVFLANSISCSGCRGIVFRFRICAQDFYYGRKASLHCRVGQAITVLEIKLSQLSLRPYSCCTAIEGKLNENPANAIAFYQNELKNKWNDFEERHGFGQEMFAARTLADGSRLGVTVNIDGMGNGQVIKIIMGYLP